MDPKDNAGTNSTKDAQNNPSTPVDGTQAPGPSSAPSLAPDGSGGQSSDQSASGGMDQGSPGVEVDLSSLPSSDASTSFDANAPADSFNNTGQPGNDTSAPPTDGINPAPTSVAFDSTTSTTGAPRSGLPTDTTTPPANQPVSTPGGSSSAPDLGFTGDTSGFSGGGTPMPSIGSEPSTPGQITASPAPAIDQQSGEVPPTAPIPAHAQVADKKTIVVLGVVAVVLIAAIVVLFLM